MSWSAEKIICPSMIFEICNFLFNYTILNINQATMFLREKQGAEQFKLCLQKLQYVRYEFNLGFMVDRRNDEIQSSINELNEGTIRIPTEHIRIFA